MPRRARAASQTAPIHRYLAGNAFVRGDNLDVLRQLPDECVDLIYLDPPFNSNQFYVAAFGDKGGVAAQLRDIWRWNAASELALNNLETLAFRSPEYQRLLDCVREVSPTRAGILNPAQFQPRQRKRQCQHSIRLGVALCTTR